MIQYLGEHKLFNEKYIIFNLNVLFSYILILLISILFYFCISRLSIKLTLFQIMYT